MITMFFGSPGCGKTTILARLAMLAYASGEYAHVVSNIDTKVCPKININDLNSKTLPPNTLLLIDEAGIVFNNRNFKSFSGGLVEFFKMHRHEGVDIVLFSQSWEDVDVIIRRLTVALFHVKKVGAISLIRRVNKRVGIDDNTHQIIDEYRFGHLLGNLTKAKNVGFIFRPRYYRYFDSFEPLQRSKIDVGTRLIDDKQLHRFQVIEKVRKWLLRLLLVVFVVWLLSVLT